ncbi:hypothetical protein [Flagellimonas meridianipacifica]|uniref:Outer membrane protein with beta-barrel domain n=1 Tax=Flagellimonas meridianipacifica TaxID=1080225 RepID=A0A2T0MK10_9FLAO|nr:hypothetical protein [Allomuricauda pacifica]PRX57903.1 hypothetical protein CLV81_1917 [Allomuricauda pacifica]
MKNTSTTLGLLLSVFAIICLKAQDKKTNEYGFSVGLLTGGDVYVAELDQNFDLESGVSILGFYDFFITDGFAVGLNGSIALPYLALIDENVTFYELALALKPRFSLSDKVSYKPGFNLGYRLITSDELSEDGGTIEGLGLNLTNELQFHISNSFTPFLDVGFITQAAGGNDEFNTTFSPLIVIRGGLVFN